MIDVVITTGRAVAASRAKARLERALAAHDVTATSATIAFTDENGPKGGMAMRCAIGVKLPRRPALRVEHTAATMRLALDGALDTLERELARLIERRRDAARHPKKYYAASRLLGGRRWIPRSKTEERTP